MQIPLYASDALVAKVKLNQLKKSVEKSVCKIYTRRNGNWISVHSCDLLQGDIISISKLKSRTIFPCDIILMNGSCIVDESTLNGESQHIIKDGIDKCPKYYKFDEDFDSKSHVLYSGTTYINSFIDDQSNIVSKTKKGLSYLLDENVFISEPSNLIKASQCNTFCFDKTGTLTEDKIYLDSIIEYNDGELKKAFDFESLNVNLKLACLTCNSIIQGKTSYGDSRMSLTGDSLELDLFKKFGGKVSVFGSKGEIKKVYSKFLSDSWYILKTYRFCSKLKRMSCIVSDMKSDKCVVLVKGAPEEIFDRLAEKISSKIQEELTQLTMKGFRVMALGAREIDSTNH
ncbi:MAG: putative cation-transporting ATPase 1, partial [Paramarteilia canceri]